MISAAPTAGPLVILQQTHTAAQDMRLCLSISRSCLTSGNREGLRVKTCCPTDTNVRCIMCRHHTIITNSLFCLLFWGQPAWQQHFLEQVVPDAANRLILCHCQVGRDVVVTYV